jgi:hypothetical protein
VKAQGLEGLVAKRRDSRYEPGQRSGAWQKVRINRGQEFVIGGYTIGVLDCDPDDLKGRPRTKVSFDIVREIGLALPDVEEGTMYGSPPSR